MQRRERDAIREKRRGGRGADRRGELWSGASLPLHPAGDGRSRWGAAEAVARDEAEVGLEAAPDQDAGLGLAMRQDPLADITALEKVEAVIKSGELVR